MARKEKIARSITRALVTPSDDTEPKQSALHRIRVRLDACFTVYSLRLHPHASSTFQQLRQTWHIDSGIYSDSFQQDDDARTALQAKGDMGYSGSTFFTTADGKFLVKSVPRHFEHSFFRDDLLRPYAQHMDDELESFLTRITDFLAVDKEYALSPGCLLGFAPSHHIVMENLLVGQDEGELLGKQAFSEANDDQEEDLWKWRTWDLKPTTYFFPERDIAQGKLTSEATKSRLADEFHGKIVLSRQKAEEFVGQLKKDTQLLKDLNAVDYSLFLVRIPIPPDSEQVRADEDPFSDDAVVGRPDEAETRPEVPPKTVPVPVQPPFAPPSPPTWRTGIQSADGKYVYRAAILDFFWAKHKVQPKLMTHLVKFWNKIDPGGDKGPMSITTSSAEYQDRFTKMCEGFIEVQEDLGGMEGS